MVVGMSSRMTLVRHGETAWNSEGRMQGLRNSPLTESGVRQAEATALALVGRRFEAYTKRSLLLPDSCKH